MSELTIDYRLHQNSGIGRYLRSVLPFLMENDLQKINLLSGEKEVGKEISNRVRKITLTSGIYTLHEQIEIPQVVPTSSNLLWVPHYNIPCFYPGKLLATVHDLAHLALPNLFSGLHKQIYANTMFMALKHKADKIICVSEFTKNELIKFTNIDEDKVKVIYNGIEEHWYGSEKVKNPESSPYLLYVGNIKPHKNLSTLIKAFLELHEKIPHNLVLVGKKEGFITNDTKIDKIISGATDRIKFTGYISDEMLKQYYLHADIFVFPSLYEGFGYPPIEAMASGCPVIASNAASIPEICGDAVLYFSPSNVDELVAKIEEVVFDESKKENLIQAGIQQSRKFSARESALQTVDLIQSMMN